MPRLSSAILVGALACIAFGQTAVRDLPDQYLPPGPTMSVSIALSTPGGTTSVGVEDKPPGGWAVANISHSGSLDTQTGKVKWGPFFAPSFPTLLTYDVTPAPGSGTGCFAGSAAFDLSEQPITGAPCIVAIPAASTWTLIALAELLLISAAILVSGRTLRVPAFCTEPPPHYSR